MAGHDLHSSLNTQVIRSRDGDGLRMRLARLQWGRGDVAFSLHVDPNAYTLAGIQSTDLLSHLGFEQAQCGLMGSQCFVRRVEEDFALDDFARSFNTCYTLLTQAQKHLEACGLPLPTPEGWGHFSEGRSRGHGWRIGTGASGDGHTSPKSQTLKNAEDEGFDFVLSWIDGPSDKGWVTHYRPRHAPVSPEIEGAFAFLDLQKFGTCPQFDFEACSWRFVPYGGAGGAWDGFAETAHQWFDAHPQHFSPGVQNLLEAHAVVEPFGMRLLQTIQPPEPRREAVIRQRLVLPGDPAQPAPVLRSPYEFDVAISFAGTNRAEAGELATRLRAAGLKVFYDEFYPEQLWGQDLYVLFDEIYRKRARRCVMFVSREYAERVWTSHERQSAQARALQEKGEEYILPIRVDNTELPGLPPTIGYVELARFGIPTIAQMLIKKLAGP